MRKGYLIKATTLILVMSVAMVGCGKKSKKDDNNKETETQSVIAEATTDKSTVATTSAATVAPTETTTEATTEASTEAPTEEVAVNDAGDGGSEPENNGGDGGYSEPDPTPAPQENLAPQPQQSSGPNLSWYGESNPGDKTGCYDGFEYDSSQVYSRMMAMQSYYPEETAWDGSCRYLNRRVAGGRGLGTYWGGGGCNAFACMISDAAFGNAPSRQHTDLDAVRVGDVIYYSGNGSEHVVIVTEVKTGTVKVKKKVFIPEIGMESEVFLDEIGTIFVCAEGNTNSQVYWGRERSKNSLQSYECIIYTRY